MWRMTLVAMALQGCCGGGGGGREGIFLGGPGAEQSEDTAVLEVSTKLGLCGGVIHWREKGGELVLHRAVKNHSENLIQPDNLLQSERRSFRSNAKNPKSD